MTTRRSFLGSILALGAAPAIVRADALMRVVPASTTVLQIADDVTWSTVDFDRDTIKVVLVYRDDGRSGADHTAVTRIVHGREVQLIDCDSWPVIPAAARRLLSRA